jgi:hypothetical protein
MRAKPSLALASVLVSILAATAAPADAACKKFAFLVNDYGKEGPTRDAQTLLDKNIAEWAAQTGVKEYQTGKKTVSCELFLDFVVFDEHTCTAQATVCWGPGVKPNNKAGGEQAEATEETPAGQPPAPMRKAEAMGTVQPAAAVAAAPAADASAAPTTPVEQIAAPAETPTATPAATPAAQTEATAPAAPANSVGMETGALQAGQAMSATATEKRIAPPISDKDRAAAAAAAATAAAAAERAALAAETAAEAAKEAAAAAVAASAASRSTATATVPPLDHASGASPAHTE